MSTLDDISGEKQRLAERLSRIDAERARVVEQLAELEAAERVVSRFEQARPGARRRRGSAATAAPQASEPRQDRRRRRAAPQPAAPSLGDATLRAVAASGGGISADQIRNFLANEFGMQVRPNHLGMALQRHRRAGRLDQRDALWYPHQGTGAEAAA